MHDAKSILENSETYGSDYERLRDKLIKDIQNDYINKLSLKQVDLLLEFLNTTERLVLSLNEVSNLKDNCINDLVHTRVDKVSHLALKHSKEIDEELNNIYKQTNIKNYVGGLVRSIRENK